MITILFTWLTLGALANYVILSILAKLVPTDKKLDKELDLIRKLNPSQIAFVCIVYCPLGCIAFFLFAVTAIKAFLTGEATFTRSE